VAEGSKQAPLTVTHDSPTFYRCRWNIAPTLNNTGAFLSVFPNDDARRDSSHESFSADTKPLASYRLYVATFRGLASCLLGLLDDSNC
jgi:hypothetical protein